jgi:hypothetical protein
MWIMGIDLFLVLVGLSEADFGQTWVMGVDDGADLED